MKHPYHNLLSRIAFCVERNGFAEVFLIPFRMGISPLLIPLLPKREIPFDGRLRPYFYHRYNVTWANERAIEIPIARACLEGVHPGQILEIGNVLSHYGSSDHMVLDKFETGSGVVNEDILTWEPRRKFEVIISISTFEHIGFDDEEKDGTGQKILSAIQRCREFLHPGGRLILTAAGGYNPAFDALVGGNRFGATRNHLYRRVTRGKWEPCDEAGYLSARYNHPYAFGNAVVVAEFSALTESEKFPRSV
jgi:hypothetical protein